MPRSIATPTPPATRKASGHGDEQRPVEEAGDVGADQLLDDEGGVGAEHDQLAVRHVDDAHHPEGDGEADRGEQQHRAERQAEPDVLQRPHIACVALDFGDAPWPRAAISGSSADWQRRQQPSARRCRRARRRRRPPRPARGASASEASDRRRLRLVSAAATPASVSADSAVLDRLELLGVGRAEGLLAAASRFAGSGLSSGERRDRRADAAAQQVVHLDRAR